MILTFEAGEIKSFPIPGYFFYYNRGDGEIRVTLYDDENGSEPAAVLLPGQGLDGSRRFERWEVENISGAEQTVTLEIRNRKFVDNRTSNKLTVTTEPGEPMAVGFDAGELPLPVEVVGQPSGEACYGLSSVDIATADAGTALRSGASVYVPPGVRGIIKTCRVVEVRDGFTLGEAGVYIPLIYTTPVSMAVMSNGQRARKKVSTGATLPDSLVSNHRSTSLTGLSVAVPGVATEIAAGVWRFEYDVIGEDPVIAEDGQRFGVISHHDQEGSLRVYWEWEEVPIV
ncbi:hypothetical protein [Microbulbifer sp. ARAS458-1]|uniref:hypothetical protein n=1 Tax=Microbulbifer sp. ARAS458-1 TaxID=3140242 RepID=UPI003877B851